MVNRLFAVREAANAVYLFGSEENYAIAKALGEAIAAALMVPEIGELFTVSLVLGWAFAESVYDVKTLLSGGRIPLLKNDDSWHYGLQGILQGDLAEATILKRQVRQKESYEDYLRVFFFLPIPGGDIPGNECDRAEYTEYRGKQCVSTGCVSYGDRDECESTKPLRL